jgi:energy-coupling factor transporter ATP-binding protein EcfA2
MPSRDTTESPFRRGVTPSNKRKFRETYDPSINEQFPQDPWHTLNHESIIDQVGELCDELTIPLERYVGIDEAIENLKKQAEDARKLPDMKKLRVAVLGEQGVGKSTLVNALLDRKILDNSAGSTACTAYATTIEYKPGVADNTQVSDVKIEFFSEEEIDAFVKDQHNRWADCYPGPQARRRDLAQDSDESSSDEFSSEGSTPVAATDAEKEKLKNSAKTAKEFFGIVFDIKGNAQNKEWLENILQKTNIREGDFRQRCILQAREQLHKTATKLKAENGFVLQPNVTDKKLGQIKNIVKKIWPFVKAVTVATGHVLLRHGICFVDLPGMALILYILLIY